MSLGYAKGKQLKAWLSQYTEIRKLWPLRVIFKQKSLKLQNLYFSVVSNNFYDTKGAKIADPILESSLKTGLNAFNSNIFSCCVKKLKILSCA
jgi:hypothetical protein